MLSYSIHFLLHLIGEAGLARSVGLGLGETSRPIAADRENSKVRQKGCQKGVKELSLFRQRLAGCPTSGPTVTTAGYCGDKGKRNSGVSSSTSRNQTEKSPRRCSLSTSASVLPGEVEIVRSLSKRSHILNAVRPWTSAVHGEGSFQRRFWERHRRSGLREAVCSG